MRLCGFKCCENFLKNNTVNIPEHQIHGFSWKTVLFNFLSRDKDS